MKTQPYFGQPCLRQVDLGLGFSPGTLPKILLQVPAGDSPSDAARKNAPLELVPTEAPVVQELMEVIPPLTLESGQ